MKEEDIADRASRIAIVSSRDPEKDRAEIWEAAVHDLRMEEGICPNGCGPMIWDDPNNQHCPACQFYGFTSLAYNGRPPTVN